MEVSWIDCVHSIITGFLLASRLGFAPNTLKETDYSGIISDLVDFLTISRVYNTSDSQKLLPLQIAGSTASFFDKASGILERSPM